MRSPFVMRETLDQVQAEVRHLQESVTQRSADYQTLLDKYVALAERREPDKVVVPERSRDQVIEAILHKSGTNGQLRSHLSAWAQTQRRNQVPDPEIIQHILIWQTSDEEGLPD